jgi:hypothetical protein
VHNSVGDAYRHAACGNAQTQILLNSIARDFSDAYMKEKIVSRLVASIALIALAAGLTGCAVAPAYDYSYAQPYYPGYGYAYGPPVYGTIGIWGGGPCCYYNGHGGDHWHGHGDWHGGGWHGGGWHGGGYGGSHGGTWSSGGGHGGHGH